MHWENREGYQTLPGRASDADPTEHWQTRSRVNTEPEHHPSPRPLHSSTISLYLQSVQHLQDEVAHAKVQNWNRDWAGLLGRARPRAAIPHLFR